MTESTATVPRYVWRLAYAAALDDAVVRERVAEYPKSFQPVLADIVRAALAGIAEHWATRDAAVRERDEARAEVARLRIQLEQARAGMSALLATVNQLEETVGRLGEVRRRLHDELVSVMDDAQLYRDLTPQVCPTDEHTGWFAPSEGKRHRCPWCQLVVLFGHVEDEAKLPAASSELEGQAVVEDADAGAEAEAHGRPGAKREVVWPPYDSVPAAIDTSTVDDAR